MSYAPLLHYSNVGNHCFQPHTPASLQDGIWDVLLGAKGAAAELEELSDDELAEVRCWAEYNGRSAVGRTMGMGDCQMACQTAEIECVLFSLAGQ